MAVLFILIVHADPGMLHWAGAVLKLLLTQALQTVQGVLGQCPVIECTYEFKKLTSPIRHCVLCTCLRIGNAAYAAKFGRENPTVAANATTRAGHPYVNMFRVANVKDVVPKVKLALPTLQQH